MEMKLSRAICVIALVFGASAHAETNQVVGYQCLKLDTRALGISSEDAWAGRGFPSVFSGPSPTSAKIGTQIGLVYAKWPLIRSNGFIQILRANGQIGWLRDEELLPLRKADGSVGGCRLAWNADHRVIRSQLDPGVSVGQ